MFLKKIRNEINEKFEVISKNIDISNKKNLDLIDSIKSDFYLNINLAKEGSNKEYQKIENKLLDYINVNVDLFDKVKVIENNKLSTNSKLEKLEAKINSGNYLLNNINKKISDVIKNEVIGLNTKISILADSVNDRINKNNELFKNRLSQIELLSQSDDELMNNPFGISIINELVSRVFMSKEISLENKKNQLDEKENEIKIEINKLNKMKSFGNKTATEINKLLSDLDIEKNEAQRKTILEFDKYDILAKNIEYTINFIKQCLK